MGQLIDLLLQWWWWIYYCLRKQSLLWHHEVLITFCWRCWWVAFWNLYELGACKRGRDCLLLSSIQQRSLIVSVVDSFQSLSALSLNLSSHHSSTVNIFLLCMSCVMVPDHPYHVVSSIPIQIILSIWIHLMLNSYQW